MTVYDAERDMLVIEFLVVDSTVTLTVYSNKLTSIELTLLSMSMCPDSSDTLKLQILNIL